MWNKQLCKIISSWRVWQKSLNNCRDCCCCWMTRDIVLRGQPLSIPTLIPISSINDSTKFSLSFEIPNYEKCCCISCSPYQTGSSRSGCLHASLDWHPVPHISRSGRLQIPPAPTGPPICIQRQCRPFFIGRFMGPLMRDERLATSRLEELFLR